jgi:hypothetical protein
MQTVSARGSRWESGAVAPLYSGLACSIKHASGKPDLPPNVSSIMQDASSSRRSIMNASTTLSPAVQPVAIPVRHILPWALFAGLLALLAIYFVGVEEGALAVFNSMYVHEFVHDGRHLLGFPCH